MKKFSRRFNERRARQTLTYCRRCELAPGSRIGSRPSRKFLRSLRRFDKDLEMYWHPHKQCWLIYRVRRHADPASDELFLEFKVVGINGEYRDPGPWVIDRLREADITHGGTVDPDHARAAYVQNIGAASPHQIEAEKNLRHINEEIANDLWNYASIERRHFVYPGTT